MKTTHHFCQDVRGALKNWNKQQWTDVAADNNMSVVACKEWFRIKEFEGVKVIPIGQRCEGFSDQTGCPGHPIDESPLGVEP